LCGAHCSRYPGRAAAPSGSHCLLVWAFIGTGAVQAREKRHPHAHCCSWHRCARRAAHHAADKVVPRLPSKETRRGDERGARALVYLSDAERKLSFPGGHTARGATRPCNCAALSSFLPETCRKWTPHNPESYWARLRIHPVSIASTAYQGFRGLECRNESPSPLQAPGRSHTVS
jgi:hypothetical protein